MPPASFLTGSWLDFEFDAKDIIHARIDRRRKLPVTTLLYALGMHAEGAAAHILQVSAAHPHQGRLKTPFNPERFKGIKPTVDLYRQDGAGGCRGCQGKITPRLACKIAEDAPRNCCCVTKTSSVAFVDESSTPRQANLRGSRRRTEREVAQRPLEHGFKTLNLLDIDHINTGAYIRNTLKADKVESYEQALNEIYRVMRPGEPPTREGAEALWNGLFFDQERYDLAVGRVKMNMRLEQNVADLIRVLRKEDIIEVIKVLHDLRDRR